MITLQQATRAHQGTSFQPEARGKYIMDMYKQEREEFAIRAGRWIEKYPKYESEINAALGKILDRHDRLTNKYLDQKARTLSPMITGPARFPVASNSKKLGHVQDTAAELSNIDEYFRILLKRATRPDRNDRGAVLEALKEKLEKFETQREAIKEINRKARAGDGEKCPAYMLQNLGANIRSTKKKIEDMESKQGKENVTKTIDINGESCEYTEDYQEERYNFVFDGKPGDDTRTILKKHGLKWSPSRGAWTRVMTPNAKYRLSNIIK